MTLYFDEESKVWKPLQAVPDVGEEVIRWSSAEHIGNYLYLVSDSSDLHIYSYHAVTNLGKNFQSLAPPRKSIAYVLLATTFLCDKSIQST